MSKRPLIIEPRTSVGRPLLATFKRAKRSMQPNVQKSRVSASEMKNFATFHDNYQPTNTGDIDSLSLVPQGSGDHERVGQQIKAQYLRYRLKPFGNPSSTQKEGHVQRLVMIRWKGTSVPSVTDILSDGTGLWSGAPPQTPYNTNKRHMFDVLMDKLVLLGTGSTTDGTATNLPVQRFYEGTIQLKGIPINFDGATTAGAQNSIYFLRIGSDTIHVPRSFYEGVFQLYYTD